jgi:F-type H+-transporting ATPase subunit delta
VPISCNSSTGTGSAFSRNPKAAPLPTSFGVIRPTLSSGLSTTVEGLWCWKNPPEKVVLKVEVDAKLIGGVVTTIGGTVYDGSVRTQLDKIEDILQKG